MHLPARRLGFALYLILALGCAASVSAQSESTLEVDPASGPVGTLVRIRGSGFATPIGALSFTCDPARAPGEPYRSAGVATVFLWRDGETPQTAFDVEWQIPGRLEPRQGEGGGPTPIGQCAFLTAPPYEGVGFTVTPGVASLPSSGTSAHGSARVIVAFATVLSLIAALVIGHGMWQIRRRTTVG